ncbi:hypothetical protein JCM3770_001933 [Rhodotorula araucariae]
MQRLRRFSISPSTPDGVVPPPTTNALHRSATGITRATQRSPRSSPAPFDGLPRRTASAHLLASLDRHAPATTAVCSGALAEATVVRAPLGKDAGARPRLIAYAPPRPWSSSHNRPGELTPPAAPIPISPASPSGHGHHRELALAAAIRTGDPGGVLLAERRRAEFVDTGIVRAPADGDEGSEVGSAESFEVDIVDTRGGVPSTLVRAPSKGSGHGVSGFAKPLPRYATGRRLSCLATYEGLPIPPQLRGGHSAGGSNMHEAEPDLHYSLHGLRLGGDSGLGGAERPRVRQLSSSAPPPPPSAMYRPSSPAPAGFKSSLSPLTRSTACCVPRRPSSPDLGVRRASSPARPCPSRLVAASPPVCRGEGGSTFGSVRCASFPSPGGTGATTDDGNLAPLSARRASSPHPPRALASSPPHGPGGVPRIVHGFDAPARAPSPSHMSSSSAAAAAAAGRASSLARHGAYPSLHAPPSAGRHGHGHAHSHSHSHSHSQSTPSAMPSSHATTTRPRSRLANARADERLEVLASRDFGVLDEYYSSRRGSERRGERREVKREAEERLRRGYDRSLERAAGR